MVTGSSSTMPSVSTGTAGNAAVTTQGPSWNFDFKSNTVTLGEVIQFGAMLIFFSACALFITKRLHRLVRSVIRQELSRFLYNRSGSGETSHLNKPIVKNQTKESKTGSLSSVLRTLTKSPGIYTPGGPECLGYSRMDLEEDSLSSFSTRNSYDSKSLTV